MSKSKKVKGTIDQLLEGLSPSDKKYYDKEYAKLVLSEILREVMHEEGISVRKLALKSGINKSIIQAIRTEGRENITLNSFNNIFGCLGYDVIIKKKNGKKHTVYTNQ